MCVWSTHINISSQKTACCAFPEFTTAAMETRVHLQKGYANSNNPTKYLAWSTECVFFVLQYEFKYFNTITHLTSNRLREVLDTG